MNSAKEGVLDDVVLVSLALHKAKELLSGPLSTKWAGVWLGAAKETDIEINWIKMVDGELRQNLYKALLADLH